MGRSGAVAVLVLMFRLSLRSLAVSQRIVRTREVSERGAPRLRRRTRHAGRVHTGTRDTLTVSLSGGLYTRLHTVAWDCETLSLSGRESGGSEAWMRTLSSLSGGSDDASRRNDCRARETHCVSLSHVAEGELDVPPQPVHKSDAVEGCASPTEPQSYRKA